MILLNLTLRYIAKRILCLRHWGLALCLGAVFANTANAESSDNLLDLMPPSASKVVPQKLLGQLPLFGYVLTHPMPAWSRKVDGAAPGEEFSFRKSILKGVFRGEFVPKGTSFENADNQFVIIGFSKFTSSLDQHARRAVSHFQTTCSRSNMRVFPARRTQNSVAIAVACGNYSRDRARGEVALVYLLKKDDLAVSLIRHWRGSSFRSELQSQWPISTKEIEAVTDDLQRSIITRQAGSPKTEKPVIKR